MREIKFRAWDKVMKVMVYPNSCWHNINLGLNVESYFNPTDGTIYKPSGSTISPLMQFTGLRDRNGKEIYEGDTIKIESSSYGTYSVPVEYLPGRCMFGGVTWGDKAIQIKMPDREWDKKHNPCECDGAMYEAMGALDTIDSYADKNNKIEVIGNIYENPELVKK